MSKLLEITLLMFIFIVGYGQCDSNKIIFYDSLHQEIRVNQTNFIYNGFDTLFLDQLSDPEFKCLIGAYPDKSYSINFSSNYCAHCNEKAIKIIDSIDINHDGVKELFLFRQLNCSAIPPDIGPYGERAQQLACSNYEVWDVKAKIQLFEVCNMLYNQMAITTNVRRSSGYNLDVVINEYGNFSFSNLSGEISGSVPEMGTYKYFNETKTYMKE